MNPQPTFPRRRSYREWLAETYPMPPLVPVIESVSIEAFHESLVVARFRDGSREVTLYRWSSAEIRADLVRVWFPSLVATGDPAPSPFVTYLADYWTPPAF